MSGRVGYGWGGVGWGWVGLGRVPLVQLCMFSDKWLQRYTLLENSNIEILLLQDVFYNCMQTILFAEFSA